MNKHVNATYGSSAYSTSLGMSGQSAAPAERPRPEASVSARSPQDSEAMLGCPACGSGQYHIHCRLGQAAKGYEEVAACDSCGLWYLLRRPAAGQLAKLNEKCSTNQLYLRVHPSRRTLRDRLFNRLFVRGRDLGRLAFLDRLKPSVDSTRSVLDFGCGTGSFLSMLLGLRGCSVAGIESSPLNLKELRTASKWPAFRSLEEAESAGAGPFDAITLCHVLEHLHDPVATLQRLRRLAKPGARLIVEVPNAASWPAAWFGDSWLGWQLPYHFSHFTPKTLRQTLARGGWNTRSLHFPNQVVGVTYSLAASLGLRWLEDMHGHLFSILAAYCMLAPLGPLLSALRSNDFMVAVATFDRQEAEIP